MDVADIISEYGAYYIAGGQNASRLHKAMYRGADLDMVASYRPTEDTVLRMGSSVIDSVIQPFQKAWTPKGDVTFSPRPINLMPIKVDFEDNPDDLEQTWLGFLAGNDLDRKTWPFVRWVIEEHLLPGINRDIEINESYIGEYAAPTPGTAGADGTAMDGIKKQINDYITAGDITPITTGAANTDPATWVDQVEAFVADIDPIFRKMPMVIAMSDELELRFRQGLLAKYGQNIIADLNSELTSVPLFKNITVKGCAGFGTEEKIFCTVPNNFINAVKKPQNQRSFRIENVDRTVKIYTDFYKGYGFVIPELVFTNDQDLAV